MSGSKAFGIRRCESSAKEKISDFAQKLPKQLQQKNAAMTWEQRILLTEGVLLTIMAATITARWMIRLSQEKQQQARIAELEAQLAAAEAEKEETSSETEEDASEV